jgi:hypothetical protein
MRFDRTIPLCAAMLVLALVGGGACANAAAPEAAPPSRPINSTADVDNRGLTPHKALYDVELTSRRSGSQILNISGKMYFEWKPTCEAWTTDHRFNLTYEYADTPAMRISSDFSTFEPFDGKAFDYTARRERNGEVYDEIRGKAERTADGGGTAIYSMPEGMKYDLPEGTLFPMGHTFEMLRLAREGKKFFNATIFDGSDEEGTVEVNAFIGAPIDGAADVKPSKSLDTALLNIKAWHVRMAFFPLNKSDAGSDYEMDILLHDNGIISDMHVDYKDFSVRQKLSALENVPPKSCGKAMVGDKTPAGKSDSNR